MVAQVLEAFMLVCFGCSWPLSLMKNIRARSAKNMSLPFTLLIVAGYVGGIAAKFLNGQFTYVLAFYFLNLFVVLLNVPVYVVNRRYDQGKEIKLFRRLHQAVYYDFLWLYDKFGRITALLDSTPELPPRTNNTERRHDMNPLIPELNEKIQELKKLAQELDQDYLKVNSSEESLIIEGVVRSIEEAETRISRVVSIEEKKDRKIAV